MVKGSNATIRQETIKNCHSKLLTTGSVTDARRSGCPSTSRSEENVVLVRDMFNRSPRKSSLTWTDEAHGTYVIKERLEFSAAESQLRAGAGA